MKIKILAFFALTVIIMFANGCGEKMPLPSVQPDPESFGANDTSYIHLDPDWTMSNVGYQAQSMMSPTDITIGEDEYIFVADSANNRVLVLLKSGVVATRQNLNEIEPIAGPTGLDIDRKLNLLMVNGSDTVYVWHQYLNNVGYESVRFNGSMEWQDNVSLRDSILGVHPFYVDSLGNSQFHDIAFGPEEENIVYITDKGNNRIIEINIVESGSVKLNNGQVIPLFKGGYQKDIARYGSGAGTVDNPRGITSDDAGNVYFTQLGGNFLVQKLEKQGNQFIPAFVLYEDPIMDLGRFKGPWDIAIGKENAIFVLDTGDSSRVSKFHNQGAMAGSKADLGLKGLSKARFERATGIAVSRDEIVYLADTRNHRIVRYRYTVSEEDIPDDRQR